MGKLWDALTKLGSRWSRRGPTIKKWKCPFCAMEIPFEATVCPQCQSGIGAFGVLNREVGKWKMSRGWEMLLMPIGVILIVVVFIVVFILLVILYAFVFGV